MIARRSHAVGCERWVLSRRVLAQAFALGMSTLTGGGAAAAGQTGQIANARPAINKISQAMVWTAGPAGTQVPLWPQGRALQQTTPSRPEEVGDGSKLVAGRPWHYATYVSNPTMTIFPPKAQNTHAAILVLPGGGYEALAMDLEGTEICQWASTLGITCAVLKYRVPQAWRHGERHVEEPPKVQLALQDAQRAVCLLRHGAAYYRIDPRKIGVIGFSAGGHLAAAISNVERATYTAADTADREPSRPDFAILLYPGHLWDESSAKTSLQLSPWVAISPGAPPTLSFHAMNDPVE